MAEELVDFEVFREDLLEKLEAIREFRSHEAADRPGEERFGRAAEALRRSFHDVEDLPLDDVRLRTLALVALGRDDQARMHYVEQEDHLIGRHGLEDATQTTDELLAALVAAAKGAGD